MDIRCCTASPPNRKTAPFLNGLNGTLYGTRINGGKYGAGLGTVFSITPAGKESVLHSFGSGTDGSNPYAGLHNLNGTLYGTTQSGGTFRYGTVFSITP